jgi:signal transduction histidine kinase
VLGARVRSLVKLKRATDALADTVRKLRELEKVRDDLLNMLVHDLKSPLAGVLATLEMAGDGDFGPVPPAAREALTQATGAARSCSRSSTTCSRSRGSRRVASRSARAARSGAGPRDVARDWAVRFAAAGVRAEVDERAAGARLGSSRTVPSYGACSTTSWRRAHARRAAVGHRRDRRVRRARVGARRGGRRVLFTVSDNGPGVPSEYQELIFRKFETVKLPGALRARGSGLGLAFCRMVVEAHGGRVWVQSGRAAARRFTCCCRGSRPCRARASGYLSGSPGGPSAPGATPYPPHPSRRAP